MRVPTFLSLCLALTLFGCGQMHAIEGLSNETNDGSANNKAAHLEIEKDLKVSGSGEMIVKGQNEVRFSTGNTDSIATIRYKFNSFDAAAIQINHIMVTCASNSPMRIFGKGHHGEILDLNKASLQPNSSYSIETEVKSSCAESSIDVEVWTGAENIQPTRYLKCGDDIYLPMQLSNLIIMQNKSPYVNASTFCGRRLPEGNREFHRGSILTSFLGSQRDLEVTVNGVAFRAISKLNVGSSTLQVTCSESGTVFEQKAFSECGEMIDDETLIPNF